MTVFYALIIHIMDPQILRFSFLKCISLLCSQPLWHGCPPSSAVLWFVEPRLGTIKNNSALRRKSPILSLKYLANVLQCFLFTSILSQNKHDYFSTLSIPQRIL